MGYVLLTFVPYNDFTFKGVNAEAGGIMDHVEKGRDGLRACTDLLTLAHIYTNVNIVFF